MRLVTFIALSNASRHDLLLAGILFAILATGIALVARRAAVAAIAVATLALLTTVAVHAWWLR